ncbi:13883_t:CDS:2, partial [Funneliformis caledonium]
EQLVHYAQRQDMNQIYSDYPPGWPQAQMIYDPSYQGLFGADASMFILKGVSNRLQQQQISYQNTLRSNAQEFVPQAVSAYPKQQYPPHQSAFRIDAPEFILKTANSRLSFVQTQRELRVETSEFVLKSSRNEVAVRKIAVPRRSRVPRKLDGPNDLKQSQRSEVRKDVVNANDDDGDDEEREEIREELRKIPRKLSVIRKEFLKNHRNKAKLKQRKKKLIEAKRSVPVATKAPCEVFLEICFYLPPSDLYSITRVCKTSSNGTSEGGGKFRNGYKIVFSALISMLKNRADLKGLWSKPVNTVTTFIVVEQGR